MVRNAPRQPFYGPALMLRERQIDQSSPVSKTAMAAGVHRSADEVKKSPAS